MASGKCTFSFCRSEPRNGVDTAELVVAVVVGKLVVCLWGERGSRCVQVCLSLTTPSLQGKVLLRCMIAGCSVCSATYIETGVSAPALLVSWVFGVLEVFFCEHPIAVCLLKGAVFCSTTQTDRTVGNTFML